MVVNTKTLIHFTNSIDNLLSILRGDFLPHMSLEDYSFISKYEDRKRAAIPIVCFCDIPFHLVSDHMTEYGHYGIGLKKEWGIKAGLNPVIYIKDGSQLHKSIYDIKEYLFYAEKNIGKFTERDQLVWNLLAYLKPYDGKNAKTGKQKIFYDECEWRFSPDLLNIYEQTKKLPILFESDFKDKCIELNNIISNYPLKYSPDDIKYLIVEAETDIPIIIRKITEIKSPKYEDDKIDILKSKIIPAQYMLEDF